MAEQIIISNDRIKATISTLGAEIQSVTVDGKENIWEGDPNVWSGHAPLLFPICGGLRDDAYVFGGKSYTLEKHGYARFAEFTAEKVSENEATFLLCSDDTSRKQFPFEYELRVTYTIEENKINVVYSVKNTDAKDMYFSIGAHEAYACPEGIEEYSIEFEKSENLVCNALEGNYLSHETYSVGENTRELALKYDYFAVDALVFLSLKSRKAFLKNRTTGRKIEVDYDGFDYLLLWTKPGAKYICIEPWCGIPDFADSTGDFTKKEGIIRLAAGDTYVRTHSMVF